MSEPVETVETTPEVVEEKQRNKVLLTEEGELTDKFFAVLRTVFLKYARLTSTTVKVKRKGAAATVQHLRTDEEKARVAALGRKEMNAFTRVTNGEDLPDEQWKEVTEYLDTNDKGELTFKGFIGLYALQTGALRRAITLPAAAASTRVQDTEEAETIKDLKAWGYDPETLDYTGIVVAPTPSAEPAAAEAAEEKDEKKEEEDEVAAKVEQLEVK
ncbi:uncharacterized protein JCM10292_006463 [Rhodotorula paludigena]|uniref:uncharacterized protein n=1 Tax=Rhodotorula paludigena TaxID=86838 RepID=UPI00316B31D4